MLIVTKSSYLFNLTLVYYVARFVPKTKESVVLYPIFLMLLFLMFQSTSYAETCNVAQLEQNSAVVAPCVILNEQQFNFTLEFATDRNTDENYYWQLNQFTNSTCTPSVGQCAYLDDLFNLNFPIQDTAGQKYLVNLNYAASDQNSMLWQFNSAKPIDTTNVVSLNEIAPNPNGTFEKLFALKGDVVTGFEQMHKDFTVATSTKAPTKQLKLGETIKLKIYHFNDLHNNLRVAHATKGDTHYFSQMVKIVKQAREQAANNPNEIVLFLSAGDDHIGNPLDELLGYDVDSFQISPAYKAYSAAGLDAAVIGNHELDRGSALLAKMIETSANFPVLSANLYGSQNLTNEHYVPAIVGVAKGLRIGVIGLTTEQETLLRSKDDPNLDSGDILQTLANTMRYVDEISDVIILLTHIGYNGELPNNQPRHELTVGDVEIAELASQLTNKPLVIIGGHMHLNLNDNGLLTMVNSVPILQAKAKGSNLGEASFDLVQTTQGLRYQMTSRLIALKNRDNRVTEDNPNYANLERDDDYDAEFETTVMQPLYAMLEDKLQQVLGMSGTSDDLSHTQTINDRYVGESAIANFMNDAIVVQSETFPSKDGQSQKVDIAAFNASGVNAGIEPGKEITFNSWYDVMPFADMIVVTPMTGAQVKQLVESNAKRVVRPEELQGENALNLSGYISRGFLHFSKDLRYSIKLNADATQAIAENITFKGEPIENLLDKRFNVAFGDYIALRGGEGWKGEKVGAGLPDGVIGFNIASLAKNDTGLVYRNEIIAYIKEVGVIDETTGAVKDGRVVINP